MKRIFLLCCIVTMVIIAACDRINNPADEADAITVRTTITGRVIDENGMSVQGALVSGHGKSTSTNANGVFVLSDVTVPSTRAAVTVTKSGYFTGARAVYPSASKTTTVLLTLQQAKQTRTISAASGGQVTLGSARVDLPANGYVDAQGNPYSGTISVAARYQDPTTDNFYESFSGDMMAVRGDGSVVELTSYGVLRVLLTGEKGQPLNLRQGSSATLTYPAAGATSASIPLWYFDESRGCWKEEGSASLVGSNYVGTVSHFTDWNLDVPNARRAFIEGRVTCGANIPLAGIVVKVGQVTLVTNQDGAYRRRVPADLAFDVEVQGSRNDGISAGAVSVGPIAENQTLTHDIVVSSCPTILQAQIVDCSNNPIGGFVQVVYTGGVKIASSSTGKITVPVPGGTALTLEGYSTAGLTFASTPVAPIAAGTVFDAGNLKACNGVTTDYVEILVPDGETPRMVTLNTNGSEVAIVTQQNIHVFSVTTGTKSWSAAVQGSTQYPSSLKFVANNQRVALMTNRGTTVFDNLSGQTLAQVTATGKQYITSDGTTLYVLADTSKTGSIQEYDVAAGTVRRSITVGTSLQKTNFLGLQGDARAVIQGIYLPAAVLTVDLSSGNVLRTYDGISDSVYLSETSALSPTGNIVIVYGRGNSGTTSGGLTAVDLVSGKVISRIQTQSTVSAISYDDAQYVSRAYTQGALPTLMTLRTQQLVRVLPWNTQSQYDIPTVFAFSGDGARLAGMSSGGANLPPNTTNGRVRIYTIK